MDNKTKTPRVKYEHKQQRVFSRELKKKLVEQIEFKKLNVRDVVNLYRVSETSVYKWINKYSAIKRTGTRMVVARRTGLEGFWTILEPLKERLEGAN